MAEFTEKQREKLADKKEAMPDGSFPIRNRSDLKNAIKAFGRSKNPEKTKAWIKRRAKELDAEDLLPESWKEEMEHSDYILHYGVLGMKWGVRKQRSKSNRSRRKARKKQISNKEDSDNKSSNNIKKMTDAELKRKINRLQLEKQYKDLSRQTMSDGKRIVNDILKNSARNVGTQALTKYSLIAIDKAYEKRQKKKS